MNFDNMSEAELDAYLAKTDPNKRQPSSAEPDFDNMSESELDAYLANDGSAQPQEGGSGRVINEQYEPIQGKDRFYIKNFGGDHEGIMNYLHKEHPQSEFKMEGDEVLGRDRGSKDWKKMDQSFEWTNPSTWEAQDISDIGTDIVGGLAEGAAGTLGAGVGLAATPAGSMAAGSLAAGGAGAGIEALKQNIAKHLTGTRKNIDYGDVALSGGLSAALTPLLGVGGGSDLTKKLTKKFGKKIGRDALQTASREAMDLNAEAAASGLGKVFRNHEEVLAKAAKDAAAITSKSARQITEGLLPVTIGDSAKSLGKTIGKTLGGIPLRVMDSYFKFKPVIDRMEPSDYSSQLRKYVGEVTSKMKGIERSASQAYEPLKEIPYEVNLKGYSNKAEGLLQQLKEKAKENGSTGDDKVIDALQEFVDSVFKKSKYSDKGGIEKTLEQDPVTGIMKVVKKKRDVGYIDKVDMPQAIELRKNLYRNMNMGNLKKITEDKKFAADPAAREISALAFELRDSLDTEMNQVTKGAWGKATDNYREVMDASRVFKDFKNKHTGEFDFNKYLSTVKNPETESFTKKNLLEELEKAEDYVGMGEQGKTLRKVLEAYKTFGKGQADVVSKSGTGITLARTAGSATLGALGGLLTGGAGFAPMIGAGLGIASTGPMGIRAIGSGGQRLAKTIGKAAALRGKNTWLGNAALQSAINMGMKK